MWLDIQDLITYATFGDDWLRGLGVAVGRISHVPIDLRRHPYNTLALLCECVIRHAPIPMDWASDSPKKQTTYTLFTFSTQTDEQTDRYCLGKTRVTYDNECS